MKLAQRILRLIHPEAEAERCKERALLKRAQAEVENLTRTVTMSHVDFRKWLEADREKKLTEEK